MVVNGINLFTLVCQRHRTVAAFDWKRAATMKVNLRGITYQGSKMTEVIRIVLFGYICNI